MKCFIKVLNYDRQNMFAWVSKGNILYDDGDYSMALMNFDNAMKYDPKSNCFMW